MSRSIIELQHHAEAVARHINLASARETTASLREYTEDRFNVSLNLNNVSNQANPIAFTLENL